MIAEGDIPGGPPGERSRWETCLARARAVFADEGMDALLADCREQEVAVLQQAEAACHAPLRKDEKAAAKALTDDAGRRLDTLFRRCSRVQAPQPDPIQAPSRWSRTSQPPTEAMPHPTLKMKPHTETKRKSIDTGKE